MLYTNCDYIFSLTPRCLQGSNKPPQPYSWLTMYCVSALPVPETSFGLQNGQTQDFCRIALDCKLFFLVLFSILQLVIVVCATRYQRNSMMALKKARMPRCDED